MSIRQSLVPLTFVKLCVRCLIEVFVSLEFASVDDVRVIVWLICGIPTRLHDDALL